jgi:hypothetical protein
MSGRVMTGGPALAFKGAKGAELKVATRAYYLENYFGEEKLLKLGIAISVLLILIILGTVLI